jgi:hypothetical protein
MSVRAWCIRDPGVVMVWVAYALPIAAAVALASYVTNGT